MVSVDDNGRVTMARLDERMREMLRRQGQVEEKLDGVDQQVRQICMEQASCVARQDQRWQAHDREHQQLNIKKNIGDAVTGAMAIIAAALGVSVNN